MSSDMIIETRIPRTAGTDTAGNQSKQVPVQLRLQYRVTETASNVNGVQVKAGYFTTDKTVIYYAAFKLGESTVYLENAGNKGESENAKTEIASAVQSLTLLKDFNINIIAK